MSTKIYDAYIFDIKNLQKLRDKLFKLKKGLLEEVQKHYTKECGKIMASFADAPHFSDNIYHTLHNVWSLGLWNYTDAFVFKNKDRSIWTFAQMAIQEQVYRNVAYSAFDNFTPTLDFTISVTIIPYEDKLLGKFFYNNPIFSEIIKNLDYISDFSYWNNVDQPDDISNEEWDNRKNVWDAAFGDCFTFADAGFTYNLVTHTDYSYMSSYTEDFPSKSERALQIAKQKVLNNVPKSLKWHEYGQYMSEHQDEINTLAAEIEKELSDITQEYLQKTKITDVIPKEDPKNEEKEDNCG